MNIADLELARLYELGVEFLIGTLSHDETAEYEQLRARTPAFDLNELERAAAALQLAAMEPPEPLPERLRIRVATDAVGFFHSWEEPSRAAAAAPARPEFEWRRQGGWLAAAAASVLAAVAWFERAPAPARVETASVEHESPGRSPGAPAESESAPAPIPAATSVPRASAPQETDDPAAARERLLASNRFLLQRPWRSGNDATGLRVAGDVVWDARTQRGFMRLSGLRRNNPTVEQYQLWIFDARRDERYPVDGGVFDIVTVNGEQVVPIRASLKVGVPLMFAITVERPGGVVVSDRSRIAALANSG